MKFLHTSDWHIGATIRNRSRDEEHRLVFAEMLDIGKEEQIDALLVTGDIFHQRRPSVSAQGLLGETLAAWAEAGIPVVMIGGNHDDPELLATYGSMGGLLGIDIVSGAEGVGGRIKLIEGQGERAMIGALPYVHPHQVLPAALGVGESEEARYGAYQEAMRQQFLGLENEMRRNGAGAVTVMMGHVDTLGTEYGGGEYRANVYPIDPALLPAHVQYVALGHIHKPQAIPGARAKARYAGSPIQMDFGERDHHKSVTLVEVKAGRMARVEELVLTTVRPLLRVQGTAAQILAQGEGWGEAWVEVVLEPDSGGAALVERVRALPGVVAVRAEVEKRVEGALREKALRASPEQLFANFHRQKNHGLDPAPQLVALFNQLYEEEAQ